MNQGTKPWTTHFAGQRKVLSRGSIVNMRWADGAYAYRGGVQDVYLDFNADGSIRVISADGRLILNAPIPYGDNAVALGVVEGRASPGITCRQYTAGDRAASTVNVRFTVLPSTLGTASGAPVGVNFGCP